MALADFDKVIELDAHYAKAYYFKGLTLNGIKRKQEALENYRKFLQYAKPDDMEIIW
ncbi:serine/threonine-protein phosphatase 5 [Propionispora vibrioides]|uniref:Serine/threonine-protein phosphatase 5 n=1 Tax=Propionispora vibrioides TaxID=112903 RepID=A0A1H8XT44_9FIRM|nr:serine/threonine-protein phosphatase 5 [Propionispora vibrioides]